MRLRESQRVFILDIKDYGSKLLFAIKNLFQYRRNHWTDQYEYEQKVRLIYLELFQQLAIALNDNKFENEFLLELLHLPKYSEPVFDTVYQIQYNTDNELEILSNLTREIGVFLFNEIRNRITNEVFRYEYVVEQAAHTYIVISVYDVLENI
jgi:hypothetical protein